MNPLDKALSLLPHGAEFRFLDRLAKLDPGQSGAGGYKVRGDEPFLRGHFPGQPIFPGVLLVEAAAQLAGVVAQSDPKIPPLAGLKLTALRNVKISRHGQTRRNHPARSTHHRTAGQSGSGAGHRPRRGRNRSDSGIDAKRELTPLPFTVAAGVSRLQLWPDENERTHVRSYINERGRGLLLRSGGSADRRRLNSSWRRSTESPLRNVH